MDENKILEMRNAAIPWAKLLVRKAKIRRVRDFEGSERSFRDKTFLTISGKIYFDGEENGRTIIAVFESEDVKDIAFVGLAENVFDGNSLINQFITGGIKFKSDGKQEQKQEIEVYRSLKLKRASAQLQELEKQILAIMNMKPKRRATLLEHYEKLTVQANQLKENVRERIARIPKGAAVKLQNGKIETVSRAKGFRLLFESGREETIFAVAL